MRGRVATAFSNTSLWLTILPTEKCNYACSYCYEDFVLGRMSETVSSNLIEFISSRLREIDTLGISWFGGEPLLAVDIIQRIMMELIPKCISYNVNLYSNITTNGHLLTESIFKKLTTLKISCFQITIDGQRQFHDQRRRTRAGKGTFDRIVGNIRSMCGTDIDFAATLRVHIDHANINSLGELFQEIEAITSDGRITVALERIKYLGRELQEDILPMSDAEFRIAVAALMKEYKGSKIRFVDVLRGMDEYICYASLPNNFIVRADGRLQKCTVALNDDRNTVGRIDSKGKLLINEHCLRWISVWRVDDPSGLGCPAMSILKS